MPPLAGPRDMLCCTRYPVKTSMFPSSIFTGNSTISWRSGSRRILRSPRSSPRRSAARSNCCCATAQGLIGVDVRSVVIDGVLRAELLAAISAGGPAPRQSLATGAALALRPLTRADHDAAADQQAPMRGDADATWRTPSGRGTPTTESGSRYWCLQSTTAPYAPGPTCGPIDAPMIWVPSVARSMPAALASSSPNASTFSSSGV